MQKVYVLVGLLLVSVSFAEEINVPSDYSTIQAAIDAASSGDTVSVAAGTYVESITMKDGVALIGTGADVCTIDGDGDNDNINYDSVVTCSGCSAGTRLEGFTITNDYSNFGGMYNYNSSVEIESCIFESNTGVYGGGMCNWGSSLTISNCTFNSNTSDYGGGIYNYGVTAQVNNCTFTSNFSVGNGAAVYNSSNLPTTSYVYLTGCTFIENASQYSNDYVIYSALSSTLTLTNCTLYKNLPKAIYYNYIDGGGNSFDETIYVDDDEPAHYDVIQDAIDASVNGDTIVVMPGRYYENLNMSGKAITLQSSDPTDSKVIVSTILDGNAADSVITCTSGEGADTIITGFVITNGKANRGGGMCNDNSDPTITNCTFSGNTGNYAGGGMCNSHYSSPTVTNCTFRGNTTPYLGGGICNNDSSPIISSCTFSGNTADEGGGMFNNIAASPTISNCTFNSNTANEGGGMYNHCDSSPMISHCNFSDNTANDGGGIYNYYDSSTTVANSYFCYNTPEAIEGVYIDNGENNFEFCPPQGTVVQELFGDSDSDGDVDMADFAAFAENWLSGVE